MNAFSKISSIMLITFLTTISVTATDYYISNTNGSNTNNGLSSTYPWKNFNHINNITLQPGDRILLHRGSTWNQELNLTGNGTAQNKIILTAYGSGSKPHIRRTDANSHRGVVINNASFWDISELKLSRAKLGIYLRYVDNFNNFNMTIRNCHFEDINGPTEEAQWYNFEYAHSSGIFVGGLINNNLYPNSTVLNGFHVYDCTFDTVNFGINSFWYTLPTPAAFKQRVVNITVEGCEKWGPSTQGLFAFGFASYGNIRKNRNIDGGGVYTQWGHAGGFLSHCDYFTIDDNEFANMERYPTSGDGVGFDYEGDCRYMTFSNNVVHGNDAAAMLIFNTGKQHESITIRDNTFYNNTLYPKNADDNWDVNSTGFWDPNTQTIIHHTGTLQNNGIYRNVNDGRHLEQAWLPQFSQSNNRLNLYSSVSNRSKNWQFNTNGNFQGWVANGQVQWPSVTYGVLQGQANGNDPFVTSPATWVNSHSHRYLKIRLGVNYATTAQVFFITETDPNWNGAKSVIFAVTPGSTIHEYVLDMRQLNASFKGVITQMRLDPTTVNGDMFWIDSIYFSETP